VIRVCGPGGDDYVYWGLSGHGLEYLAALAGYERGEVVDTPVVDGEPRILARSGRPRRLHIRALRVA
jgi:hypothetical protein